MGVTTQFTAVTTSIEHGKRKLYRSIFDHALAGTGGTAETSLYIGNSFVADYVGAVDAGLRCFLIDPGHRYDVSATDRLASVFEAAARLNQAWAG